MSPPSPRSAVPPSFGRLALVVLAVGWPTPAPAAQPLELSWQAPPGCPQVGTVREQIRALVPSAMLESGRLKAHGTITRVDGRFRLKLVLELENISGERSIESDSCSNLAGAAAVALGLLLQSATQTTSQEPGTTAGTRPRAGANDGSAEGSSSDVADGEPGLAEPAPARQEDTAAATPASTSPTTVPRDDDAVSARSWRAFLEVPQLAANVGPMPEPSLGVAVAAGVSVPQWLFAAVFQFPQTRRLTLPSASGAAVVDVQHLATALETCRSWRSKRLELAPCLSVGLERIVATGSGDGVASRSARAMWVSVGAAALGRWYIADWLAVAATLGGKIEGARPTIRIEGLAGSRRMAPAALTFRTGPVLIF